MFSQQKPPHTPYFASASASWHKIRRSYQDSVLMMERFSPANAEPDGFFPSLFLRIHFFLIFVGTGIATLGFAVARTAVALGYFAFGAGLWLKTKVFSSLKPPKFMRSHAAPLEGAEQSIDRTSITPSVKFLAFRRQVWTLDKSFPSKSDPIKIILLLMRVATEQGLTKTIQEISSDCGREYNWKSHPESESESKTDQIERFHKEMSSLTLLQALILNIQYHLPHIQSRRDYSTKICEAATLLLAEADYKDLLTPSDLICAIRAQNTALIEAIMAKGVRASAEGLTPGEESSDYILTTGYAEALKCLVTWRDIDPTLAQNNCLVIFERELDMAKLNTSAPESPTPWLTSAEKKAPYISTDRLLTIALAFLHKKTVDFQVDDKTKYSSALHELLLVAGAIKEHMDHQQTASTAEILQKLALLQEIIFMLTTEYGAELEYSPISSRSAANESLLNSAFPGLESVIVGAQEKKQRQHCPS